MELPKAISAILFYQAEPMTIGHLSKLVKKPEGEVRDAVKKLEEVLEGTGLTLIQNGDEITLGTRPEASSLIEAITKEELSKELSKASLETLAIVLYKGPVTRSEVDYIRGVNSTFILRNLLVRGLIEKIDNPKDQRSFLYKPTFQLLEYMGAGKKEDLPEYQETMATLLQFVAEKEEAEKEAEKTPAEDAVEADIAEEDAAGKNFDDAELTAHREKDRSENT